MYFGFTNFYKPTYTCCCVSSRSLKLPFFYQMCLQHRKGVFCQFCLPWPGLSCVTSTHSLDSHWSGWPWHHDSCRIFTWRNCSWTTSPMYQEQTSFSSASGMQQVFFPTIFFSSHRHIYCGNGKKILLLSLRVWVPLNFLQWGDRRANTDHVRACFL